MRSQTAITRRRTRVALSVRDAIESYLADRASEGQNTGGAAQQLAVHVLPRWGDHRIAQLTAHELKRWRDELATLAPRRRRPMDAPPAEPKRLATADRELQRQRRSTVNRITTTFKAALNHAAHFYPREHANSAAWRVGLRAFRQVEAPRERWLDRNEIARLLTACPTDFGRLVRAALYTGCRYGELCRSIVGDYDSVRHTLRVSFSKTGRGRDVFLNEEAAQFFARVTTGRAAHERLLLRTGASRGAAAPWGPSHQARRIARACELAGIAPPISFHGLRHTYASLAVQAGMTLLVLARNLGHTDTRMVERHYGHLSDRHRREEVNRCAPVLEPAESRRKG